MGGRSQKGALMSPAEALAKYAEDELHDLYDFFKNVEENASDARSRRQARVERIHIADALDKDRWVAEYNLDDVLQRGLTGS